MSWPPSPQYPAYPEPERPSSGYPGQPAQPYPNYPQNPPGYPQPQAQPYPGYQEQPTQRYPDYQEQPVQRYPGYQGQQPTQPYSGYPQGSPGYPQPQSQPYPGYQEQPTQPYPGYSSHQAPPTAPKKSKAGMITLIVLTVVLLLCGGGGAAVYFTLKDDVKDIADAVNTQVVAPETLNGRAKLADAEVQSLIDEMVDSLKSDVPEATNIVGGFYGDPEKDDMVMIVAAAALIRDPAKEIDDAIKESKTDGMEITAVKSVDPGPLGGEAKCGDADSEDVSMAVCIWADRGSLGMVITYSKSVSEAQAEFVKIRGEIEKRS